jgi:hypothetical protein
MRSSVPLLAPFYSPGGSYDLICVLFGLSGSPCSALPGMSTAVMIRTEDPRCTAFAVVSSMARYATRHVYFSTTQRRTLQQVYVILNLAVEQWQQWQSGEVSINRESSAKKCSVYFEVPELIVAMLFTVAESFSQAR